MEIDETKLNKILTEQRKEYQRYLGILKEDFESQVKLIADVILGVQEQLIILRDMVAKNTEDITMMKMAMEIIKANVAKNTEDITIMKTDIGIIKNSLKQKVDIEEFAILEKRVSLLESKIK